MVEKAEAKPTKGGNIAKYSELTGSDKTSSCCEFTMPQFEGTTGFEFVALQLALDFENFEGAKRPAAPEAAASGSAPDKGETVAPAKAAGAGADYTPILDENVQLVGISNKAHKQTKNVIQVLYIKSVGNAMV